MNDLVRERLKVLHQVSDDNDDNGIYITIEGDTAVVVCITPNDDLRYTGCIFTYILRHGIPVRRGPITLIPHYTAKFRNSADEINCMMVGDILTVIIGEVHSRFIWSDELWVYVNGIDTISKATNWYTVIPALSEWLVTVGDVKEFDTLVHATPLIKITSVWGNGNVVSAIESNLND